MAMAMATASTRGRHYKHTPHTLTLAHTRCTLTNTHHFLLAAKVDLAIKWQCATTRHKLTHGKITTNLNAVDALLVTFLQVSVRVYVCVCFEVACRQEAKLAVARLLRRFPSNRNSYFTLLMAIKGPAWPGQGN